MKSVSRIKIILTLKSQAILWALGLDKNSSYVKKPGNFMSSRLGVDAALEVDIVPVLDPVGVEGEAHADGHHRLV
jgi:hypothetical protein